MGVLLALTPVVSHHYGAGRYTEIGADVRQCAWLALGLSLARLRRAEESRSAAGIFRA
jgi:Na+-driven multidrug efflux pump